MQARKSRRLALAALAAIAIGTAGYAIQARLAPDSFLASEQLSGLRLQDKNGQAFAFKSLKGQPVAVFFGFMQCPDVCPMTLQRLAAMKARIGEPFDAMQIVFVTLDPARDKAEQMASYLADQPIEVIGVTGSMAEVARTAVNFGVFHERVPTGPGNYTIDHAATIFLFDDQGERAGEIPFGAAEEEFERKIRRIL